jgi:hypothetical protein
MGRKSQLYLFPLAYQWMRRSRAVVSLRGASGWVESPNDSTVLAVYDGLRQQRG